jgi:hypothetical protein
MKERTKRVFYKAKQLRITLNAWENICTVLTGNRKICSVEGRGLHEERMQKNG